MRGFFWRGSRQEGSRGVALVAWETVPAGIPRWIGSPTFSACQYSPPDQVGGSTDATVWRYGSGDTS